VEIEEFDAHPRLRESVRVGPDGQRSARCPAHDDQHASLSYRPGDHGGVVVTCHAGCDTAQVVAHLGLTMGHLAGAPYLQEQYAYTDIEGYLLWTVQRWANPKTFRCVPGLPPPADRVLFNLPDVRAAQVHGDFLFIVEGERDVLTLNAHGYRATCNVGGAGVGKWLPQYTEMVRGVACVVIADNDEPGRAHARAIAAAITGVAKSVTMMVSPIGSDVTDLLDAGYTLDALSLLPDREAGAAYTAKGVRVRKVSWAWPRYIPFGKLTIIEGDPGDGKSVLTVDLAARWSTGAVMPDGSASGGPFPVIMVSAEDDMEDTIVPRLDAAGANTALIHLVPHGLNPNAPFELSSDMDWLTDVVMELGARAVIFDPITSFINERTDTHNDSSTRRALYPLRVLASRTGAAVLAVRHLNKGVGKALYRGGGSIGFVAAARACYLVAPHPEEPEVRLFACVKNNLGPKAPTLGYQLDQHEDVPYLVWRKGPVELDAQQALDGQNSHRPEVDEDEVTYQKAARQMEQNFLLDLLSDGPLSWTEIVAAAKEVGFSARTLRRARIDARLVCLGRPGQHDSKWAAPAPDLENRPELVHGQLVQPSETRGAEREHGQAGQAEPLLEGNSPLVKGPPDDLQIEKVGPVEEINKPELVQLDHVTEQHPGPPRAGQAGQGQGEDVIMAPLTESQRDDLLDATELVCDICQTTTEVTRWGAPYWKVRCFSHNPLRYFRDTP
jgi:hypothetical protein